jgi:DNA invertase Pin-like site-specific DNA recombinase
MSSDKITAAHLARRAVVYVRQSTPQQVATNIQSQRRQFALVDRAIELGWRLDDVSVIDEDLAVSGSGLIRSGFDRLVADVGLGRVGLVLGIEVSRLARNNRDWYHLLDLCAIVDTLVGDGDGLYHPGVFNDRLLLGLKGTMSEVELHLIQSRLSGGLWEAARRGELRTHLPVGFVYDQERRIAITPDEAIKQAIALIFSKFAELGSARQIAAYLVSEQLPLPHQNLKDGRITWRAATFGAVHDVLTNPVYAGAYAYGRSAVERRLDEHGRLWKRQVRRPVEEWRIMIEDHHPGFISFATYQANRERLKSNWRGPKGGTSGAVREGRALLQGLLRCGRCGRKMHVGYASEANVPRYTCKQAYVFHGSERTCQSVGGMRLDNYVADVFLAALTPASLEATLAALEETERSWHVERGQRELLVQQAHFEAERAQSQFDRVEPENRLVARNLERAWEERLSTVAQREADLARFDANRPTPLSADERAWLERAGADLQAVWTAATTSNRDRKQLLRCLIKEIGVTADRDRSVAELTILWVGGAATRHSVRMYRSGERQNVTSEVVLDLVRRLAPHYTDERIAFFLNRKRLRTGAGNSFTISRVAHLRSRLGIAITHSAGMTFDDGPEWRSVDQAASELGVSGDTIRRWARGGFLEARQVMPQAPWRVRINDEVRQRIVPEAPVGWVRLVDAAKRLGRSKQTILHWVQSGRLRAVQVAVGKRKGLRIELGGLENGLFAET